MLLKSGRWLSLALALTWMAGCGPDAPQPTDNAEQVDGAKYLLSAEPPAAQNVKEAIAGAEDGAEVAVVGRIGGDTDPWIEGLAAFTIADLSLKPCNEIEGDTCETPWDYCCEADLHENRVLVKVIGADGDVVPSGARELLDLQELQTVVIQGRASRDEDGNLRLLATGIYVRP